MPEAITVFGAGSWGTALARSLAMSTRRVVLWARRQEAAARMAATRHNPSYLPDVEIPASVEITNDLGLAADHSDVWVVATPAQAVRDLAERVRDLVHPGLVVVSVAKGIEENTLLTTTQVLDEALDGVHLQRIGVLYGPSHAEEVAVGKPTTLVAAAHSLETAEIIRNAFMTPRLRVYVNQDVIGVEIGGSVKNVLAIAAGISDGIGYGDNAKAAIVTRGMAEIQRLGVAMGADPLTFTGLTGIGDVVVTCMSHHSRNRYVGEQIGLGKTLDQIKNEMQMIAEGVATTASTYALAKRYEIEMPITEAIYSILFEGKKPHVAVEELMTRAARREEWLPDSLAQNAPEG